MYVYCCLQGQLCGLWLWFWPSGKERMIQRINEDHWESLQIQSSSCICAIWPWTIEEVRPFFLSDSWQFSVLHESVWNYFGAILSDSWWFANHSENILEAILSASWWSMNHSENILGVILHNSQWFLMILSDSQISLKLFWGNSQWFLMIDEPLWKHFWGNSLWFSVICKSVWNYFGVILGDSQWFSLICESVWYYFGVILGNSQWF